MKGAKSCQAMATAETAPALLCLNARAKIAGPTGERHVALEDFFISAGVTALQDDEILSAIEIPNPPAHTGGVYLKHSLRGSIDFAIAGVAVVLTLEPRNGACNDARISLLGVARIPMRARRAEGVLKGKTVVDNVIDQAALAASEEARPLGDIFGSAAYRRKLVNVLVKMATKEALEGA